MKKGKKIWSGDLLLLKWPVILLIVCLVAGSALVGGIFWLRQRLQQAVHADQESRGQLTASIRRLEDEADVVRGHSERFGRVLASGFVGEEKRLELVETLEAVRERYKLYPLQVDIGHQFEFSLKEGGPEDAGDWLALRYSRLQVRVPLLHEGDLTELYNALQNFGQGMFVVEECLIERTAEGQDMGELILKENLKAACSILWLTLQPEKAKAEEEKVSAEPQP